MTCGGLCFHTARMLIQRGRGREGGACKGAREGVREQGKLGVMCRGCNVHINEEGLG